MYKSKTPKLQNYSLSQAAAFLTPISPQEPEDPNTAQLRQQLRAGVTLLRQRRRVAL